MNQNTSALFRWCYPWLLATVCVLISLSCFGCCFVVPPVGPSAAGRKHDPSTKLNMKKIRHFINLTNGIEVVPHLLQSGVHEEELSYIRLQSTHCESKNFLGILQDLDANFLLRLAQGDTCLVYDFGSRAGVGWPDGEIGIPRALWWGVEWVRYALERCWLGPSAPGVRVMVRGHNIRGLFEQEYRSLPDKVKRKMRYYKKFLKIDPGGKLSLYGIYSRTNMDGDAEGYATILDQCSKSGGSFVEKKDSLSFNISTAAPDTTPQKREEKSDHANTSSVGIGDDLRTIVPVPVGMRIYQSSYYEQYSHSEFGGSQAKKK
uniref:Uncharacterized protein n=1 Tax=Heterosigma akashiwo TaxID=2829 RepID=A0A7S3XSP6_HETAK